MKVVHIYLCAICTSKLWAKNKRGTTITVACHFCMLSKWRRWMCTLCIINHKGTRKPPTSVKSAFFECSVNFAGVCTLQRVSKAHPSKRGLTSTLAVGLPRIRVHSFTSTGLARVPSKCAYLLVLLALHHMCRVDQKNIYIQKYI